MEISSAIKITNQRSPARLTLLSSDIEEDLGFIDINDSKFDYIARDEYWLLNDDEYNSEIHISYENVLEWLESYPKTPLDDNYLKLLVKNNTPDYGYNRFEYLTKSVSRTATITKRKIDIYNEDMATPPCVNGKYGTITKGTLSRPFLNSNDRSINRTFDIPNSTNRTINRTFDVPNSTDKIMNRTYNGTVSNEKTNRTYEVVKMSNTMENDERDNNSNENQIIPVNTNTITKSSYRRTFATVRPSPLNFDAFDNGTSESNKTEFEDSESMNSNGQVTDNNDLKNRVYESDKVSTSRNYPTISRNITKTLLRREASQGNLNNRKLKPVYAVSSNDDLLSSTTDCSTISLRSNLSSISGRSEPNLIDAQSSLKYSTQQPQSRLALKFQSRLISPSHTNMTNGSSIGGVRSKPNHILRLTRPTHNGTNIANKKMIHQAVANNNNYTTNSKAHSFANMNSLQSNQYNMPRTVSQIEMKNNDDEDDYDMLNGEHQQKLMPGLDRKSTFRVSNRQSSLLNAQTLFNNNNSNNGGQFNQIDSVAHHRYSLKNYPSINGNANYNENTKINKSATLKSSNQLNGFSSQSPLSSSSSKISILNMINNNNNTLINNHNHLININYNHNNSNNNSNIANYNNPIDDNTTNITSNTSSSVKNLFNNTSSAATNLISRIPGIIKYNSSSMIPNITNRSNIRVYGKGHQQQLLVHPVPDKPKAVSALPHIMVNGEAGNDNG